MTNPIRGWGIVALVAFVLGMIPGFIGALCSIAGLLITTMLYHKVDKLGYGSQLLKLTIYQWIAVLIPLGALFIIGIKYAESDLSSNGLTYVLLGLCEVLLLVLAVINYFVAENLLSIGIKSNNFWFRISGTLTKFGAFTMPIALGLIFVILAQPLFLLGCIIYKPVELDTVIN